VSLSPAQVQILVNTEPIRSQLARAVELINTWGPEIELFAQALTRHRLAQQQHKRVELLHHIHTQYRRKSRGYR
jgi:hypothetical protein